MIPRINGMTFSGAATADHRSVNRANVGVIRGSLSPEFHDWRPPQVADFVRMAGTCRYAPSQSEESVLVDLRGMLDEFEGKYPGLKTKVFRERTERRHSMLPFEIDRASRIVRTLNAAYRNVRGDPQPTGPISPPCFYGTDAAHLLHLGSMEGIVCGPGGRFNTMPDERVDISDYLDMIRIYILAILDICEVA
jgi:acetylornithine deacetylase